MLTHKLIASKNADRFEQGEVILSINQWQGSLTLETSSQPMFHLEEQNAGTIVTGAVD